MVKEFCCGFSLRTGVLILTWSVLTIESFHIVLYTTGLYAYNRSENASNEGHFFIYIFAYYLVWSILGITVSILGMKAIYENKSEYLNGIYWYFCYDTIFNVFRIILMIILAMVTTDLHNQTEINTLIRSHLLLHDVAVIFAFVYLFSAAICAYFALIVRSYRDEMKSRIEPFVCNAVESQTPKSSNEPADDKGYELPKDNSNA